MTRGACLCGNVSYEIEGKISPIWLCHCSKCRRRTGSAFHASAVCNPEQFRWITGEDAISEYEDTPSYKTRFCSRCGSPVPSHLESYGMMFLHVGALEDDHGREVAHHIFVGSKARWVEIEDGHPRYDAHKPAQKN